MAKILAVDDEPDFLELLSEIAGELQHTFIGETAGRNALAVFRAEKPHIVLLDVLLADVDGLQICAAIRAESPVPVILISAVNQEDKILAGYESGANDYIVKPCVPDELKAKLTVQLRRAALEKMLHEAGEDGATLEPAGHPLGKYRLLSEIGAGGMGTVYRASPVHEPWRIVALKVLAPKLATNREFLQMFFREVECAKSVDDPRLVRVMDHGHHHGTYFYVMEYIDGESVDAIISRNGPVAPRTALRWGWDILGALAAIHEADLIHGDLSARNVLVGKDGRARLLDFCIPRPSTGGQSTTSAFMFVTPQYVAPERIEGREPTILSDLYSLGILLFYALVGHPPFSGELSRILYLHVHEQLRIPGEVPGDVAAFIHRLAHKSPEARYEAPGKALVDASSLLERYGQA